MEKFSKEDFNTTLKVLINLKDQSETKGFIEEKRIIDSYHADNTKGIQSFYQHLLSRIKEEIKCSNNLH